MKEDRNGGRVGRRWRVAGGIFLLVTVAGVVEALQMMVPGAQKAYEGRNLGWVLAHTLPSWWILGLLIPGVAWLGARFPMTPPRLRRGLVVHLPASLAFPFVYLGLVALLYAALGQSGEFRRPFVHLTNTYYVYILFFYWLIVGGVHLLRGYRELKERQIGELQLRSDLSQARLSALRAQLNPHFLFNSLNTVVGLALEKGEEEVADAVTELSELLRESLREDESPMVSLSREIEFTQRYLNLQEHRFGDRLTYETSMEDGIGGARVPAMILQPVVENAVIHGVLPGRGRGRIRVAARRDGERIRIDVDDTGPGFDGDGPVEEGVGLSNTRSRLRQLFGAEAVLELGDAPGGGARVSLTVPFVPGGDEGEGLSAGLDRGGEGTDARS